MIEAEVMADLLGSPIPSVIAAAGGSVLVTYAQIAGQVTRIMQRAVVEKTMPTSGPLLPAEIAKLKCWISSGALNN